MIDFKMLRNAFSPFAPPGGSWLTSPNLTVGEITYWAFRYVLIFAGIALLLYLIYGGFQYMTSAGDPAKTKGAQEILTHAVVGFIVVFIAFWLVQLAGLVFGLTDIQGIFK